MEPINQELQDVMRRYQVSRPKDQQRILDLVKLGKKAADACRKVMMSHPNRRPRPAAPGLYKPIFSPAKQRSHVGENHLNLRGSNPRASKLDQRRPTKIDTDIASLQDEPSSLETSDTHEKECEHTPSSSSTAHSTDNSVLPSPKVVASTTLPLTKPESPIGAVDNVRSKDSRKPPIIYLSNRHEKSHKRIQTFLQKTEKALDRFYVVGPIIRLVIGLFQFLGAVFVAGGLAIRSSGKTMPEEGLDDHDVITRRVEKKELRVHGKYTLRTYSKHSAMNILKSFVEMTLIGQIVCHIIGKNRCEYGMANSHKAVSPSKFRNQEESGAWTPATTQFATGHHGILDTPHKYSDIAYWYLLRATKITDKNVQILAEKIDREVFA